MRPGAPVVSHDVEGPFNLIGLAAGSEPCQQPAMRRRLNDEPPVYIDVYPYVRWIRGVISASLLPRPYPENFIIAEGGSSFGIRARYMEKQKEQKYGWKGRTFVSGNYCYKSSKRQSRTAFFYSEKFVVEAGPQAKVTVFIKISAGIQCTITCARLLVPNHKQTPVIDGVGGFNITVQLNSNWFPKAFYFTLGLNGKNSSASNVDLWWSQRGPGAWLNGNVIFGDYERDEDECSLTMQEIKEGTKCSPAYYETAITEITAHPEYTRFGVHNSLALIKLVRPLKSGCGIRSGAVIIRHDSDGMFQLIGLSVGSVPCLRSSMRRRFNKEPPLYIDVYPYVTWITSMINANTMPKPYPANFKLLQADPVHPEVKQYFTHWKGQKLAWRGHTFVAGNSCFRNSKRQKKMAFFYYESFAVWSKPPTRLNIFMKISAGIECTITCARLLLPNHKSTPIIDGGGHNEVQG
ncbi:unnamed protein product, partial [Iphiclides podalirius]